MKPSLIIIGLGNPGASYVQTRHNAGFQALDVLSEVFGTGGWKEQGKFEAVTQEARVVAVPVLLVKPQTFMNLSGQAARKIVDFYKLDPKHQVLVISDDIDLELGTIRVRQKGGPGTHNGMKSLVEQFGEEFARIRIGLGSRQTDEDLATWVLNVPPEEERLKLKKAYGTLAEMVKEFVLGNGKIEQ